MSNFFAKFITFFSIFTKNTVKSKKNKINKNELLEIGKYLFFEYFEEYKEFIDDYDKDARQFVLKNKIILSKYDNLNLEKLSFIELIYIFGNSKNKLLVTDWRGEENEYEIENFLEEQLEREIEWKQANEVRAKIKQDKQKEGEFATSLLKAIDKDLETQNKKLLFIELYSDSFVYTVIDHNSHQALTNKFPTHFHGSERLKF
ncbi:DUF6630 family protein [Hugenholtzia roseola]|uniref:DUF6630 family protein n=1 Tax=Hugenholtzia roseola TaxID=1002 RepID=UPI0003F4D03A|nr:hypothetical protein [Hugenholtzia roseola]